MCALVRVCRLDELDFDSPYHFERDGREYMLIRKPDGVYALDGICTHEYAELWRGFVSDELITCPLHLSQFNIKTGEVVTPPAEQPLRVYTVQIREGEVWVDLD
ncbi:MAG: non-heme iron oxygenase ferredoxin subunit [Thermoprotei archaeon]